MTTGSTTASRGDPTPVVPEGASCSAGSAAGDEGGTTSGPGSVVGAGSGAGAGRDPASEEGGEEIGPDEAGGAVTTTCSSSTGEGEPRSGEGASLGSVGGEPSGGASDGVPGGESTAEDPDPPGPGVRSLGAVGFDPPVDPDPDPLPLSDPPDPTGGSATGTEGGLTGPPEPGLA
jgi:hypothetical protein